MCKRLLPLAAVVLAWPVLAFGQATGVGGTWEGSVRMDGSPEAFTLMIERNYDGQWTGTIDMPSRNVRLASMGEIDVRDQYVSFEVVALPGTPRFDGTVSADGSTMSGNVVESDRIFSFELKRRMESAEGDATVLEGVWRGTLETGGLVLRLVLTVTPDPAGGVRASMDSPDRGRTDLSLSTFALEGEDLVRFSIGSLGAYFAGVLSEDGRTISGTWNQGDARIPISFSREQR